MGGAGPQDSTGQDESVPCFDLRYLPASFYENPYPTYHALRRANPVRRMPDGSLFLTRYRDVATVYRDARSFSSDKRFEFKPKYGDSPLYEHHTTSLVPRCTRGCGS